MFVSPQRTQRQTAQIISVASQLYLNSQNTPDTKKSEYCKKSYVTVLHNSDSSQYNIPMQQNMQQYVTLYWIEPIIIYKGCEHVLYTFSQSNYSLNQAS